MENLTQLTPAAQSSVCALSQRNLTQLGFVLTNGFAHPRPNLQGVCLKHWQDYLQYGNLELLNKIHYLTAYAVRLLNEGLLTPNQLDEFQMTLCTHYYQNNHIVWPSPILLGPDGITPVFNHNHIVQSWVMDVPPICHALQTKRLTFSQAKKMKLREWCEEVVLWAEARHIPMTTPEQFLHNSVKAICADRSRSPHMIAEYLYVAWGSHTASEILNLASPRNPSGRPRNIPTDEQLAIMREIAAVDVQLSDLRAKREELRLNLANLKLSQVMQNN